ncbi:MFS transporter [Aurantimonas sp. Leaf443]|uniref:MFS transporter n=1 Tax=Aurantimonas sp. Leaf443 TaxID=1736378 RepID=UPI0006F98041|nr:MFS transporter [Aurantimonas sp. Leaf443]KQT85494.1 MFS transporter [Aurantimonas sp. Leaf443]
MSATSFDTALSAAGTGRFQKRLIAVFGLVWAADAMQVLAIGFTAPSIAASFGLTVPQAIQTGTALFLGMLVGAFVFGRLADRFGRRPILVATVLLDAVFGLASAFAPDFAWLLALRFLTGLGVGGTLPVDYAMMAEFLPAERRGRWLVFLEGFWAVGTAMVALFSLAVTSYGAAEPWRILFVLTALPALVGLVLRFFIPESPLFLLRAGRAKEAVEILNRIATVNGRAAGVERLEPLPPTEKPRLFAGPYRRRTILILLVWLLVSVSYYGVFVWLPGQHAAAGLSFVRGQLFLVLVALAQIPGYALAAYGVERWGRLPTLIGFLLLSAVGCFAYALGTDPVLVALAMLAMSFALLGTWGALYALTPELYPTRLRGTGMGTAGAAARVGGLIAPSVLAPVMAVSFPAALGAFSGLLVLAAILTAMLGIETRNRPLD